MCSFSPKIKTTHKIIIITTHKMKYEINEDQMKALDVFLWRVSLTWAEVGAFNSLIQTFSSPIKEEEEEKIEDAEIIY